VRKKKFYNIFSPDWEQLSTDHLHRPVHHLHRLFQLCRNLHHQRAQRYHKVMSKVVTKEVGQLVHVQEPPILTLVLDSYCSEAIFLVMCDPSMNPRPIEIYA
jgi:hypothetical protein